MRLHRDDHNSDDLEKRSLVARCEVYLDGEVQGFCIMADEEKGEIERYATDLNGQLIRDGDDFKTETLRGKVEIKDLRND